MLTNNSLKKDTILYGVSTLLERVVSFLILPLLTKVLSQDLYVVWSQFIITLSLLSNIALLGLHTAAVRFLAGKIEKVKASSIFHGMLGLVILNSFICIFISLKWSSGLSRLMFADEKFSEFVVLFALFLSCEALFEIMAASLRAQKEILLLSVYYFLKNGLRVIILAIALLPFHLSLSSAITFIIIVQFGLVAFIYINNILRRLGFSFSFTSIPWSAIMSFSLPLIPYGILIWGNNFVDRYLVLHMININEVGKYAVSYSLAAIIGITYSILGYTLYPHLADLWNRHQISGVAETLRKANKYYLFFSIPLVAVISIYSGLLIKFLSTTQYLAGWQTVFWLAMGILFFGIYQLNMYITLLKNDTFFNVKISLVSLVANIILNIFLIPKLGILGAAVATFLSNSLLVFFTILFVKRNFSGTFPYAKVSRMILITVFTSFFLLLGNHYLGKNMIYVFSSVIIAGAIYILADLLDRDSVMRSLMRNI